MERIILYKKQVDKSHLKNEWDSLVEISRRPTQACTDIRQKVCLFYGITRKEIQSKDRRRIRVEARAVYSYLAIKVFAVESSITSVQEYINRRHCVAYNYIKIFENAYSTDEDFRIKIKSLMDLYFTEDADVKIRKINKLIKVIKHDKIRRVPRRQSNK